MAPQDIDALHRAITALEKRLKALADDDELRELLRIIRNPGWTTPAELVFVGSIVTSLDLHAKAMIGLKSELLEGSRLVGALERKAA